MKRQHGQSAVEFALIAPIIFMMIFGMIYGGIMFMEYMHYSNAVRTAARQIAVARTNREATVAAQQEWLTGLWQEEVHVNLYQPTVKISEITDDSTDVEITVTFQRVGSLPVILDVLNFPPKSIKAIDYRMRLEKTVTTSTDESTTNTDENNTDGNV